jgi:hypothetical protein
MTISQLKLKRPPVKEDDESILKRFKEKVKEWNTYYSENIKNYKADTKFAYKPEGQWKAAEIYEYDTKEKKPRLTFNMIPRMVGIIEGEYSDFDPDIMVRAIDSTEVPQEAIDLRTNFIRQRAFKSRNDIVYQTAMDCALVGGYGAFRVVVEPESPLSFNKIPSLQKIYDPTRCFWDNAARDLDKGDGNICGVHETWKKTKLKATYPDITDDIQSIPPPSNIEQMWETKDDITVADYYEKVFFKRSISLLSDGRVVDTEDAEKIIARERDSILTEPLEIVSTENRDDFYIMFYRLVHNKILERAVWDGKKLPIIFQPGVLKWYDGKEHTISFIRWLKDTQRAYNFTRSEFLYRLKLTRYEPFIAADKTIEGHEKNWKNAHTAKGVLPYKPVANVEPPRRVPFSEVPQSMSVEIERSYNDFQRITGRFDANLGAPSNETSGIAILNRQRPGNKSIQIFFDNSLRAMESGANALLDLGKHVIDTQRSINVAMPNGEQSTVEVNKLGENAPRENPFDGNDLRVGEFLVEIKASASFEIQRNAELEQIDKLIAKNPQLAAILPDKLIELSGIKDAPALIKRAQKYLIPQITADETKDEELKAELTQQIAQQQQFQQTMQQLQVMAAQSKIQDERIAALSLQMSGISKIIDAQTQRQKVQADSAVETAKINAEEDRTVLEENREVRQELREWQKEQEL